MTRPDAVVVGSGPNGLAAAVTLAAAGLSVTVVEGADRPGGGCRTEELTLSGFRHDVCSAVHPLLGLSPFFSQERFAGLRAALRHPEVPFAQPLDGGRASAVSRSVADSAVGLGLDGPTYEGLVGPLVERAGPIAEAVFGPLRRIPTHPVAVARFGLPGLLSARHLARRFPGELAPALFAGAAAHSLAPLTAPLTAAFGLLLALTAHAVGWPVLEGGSSTVTAALVAELERLGGVLETGHWVRDLTDLPPSTAVVLDTSPEGLVALAGQALPPRSVRAYRAFRHGPGVCKVDWALSGPVPWTAEACRRAGTVHVGGQFAEVAAAEAEVAAGRHPDRPFCIVVQPGVCDPSRAPAGCHTLWGYCHVPNGSALDRTASIESQIERFAPGFRDLVLARSTRTATDLERHNPNLVGGDVGGGAATLRQTFLRPTVSWNPYRTPLRGIYLCSASTPPGGGVHGMCGVYAARTALHDHFGGPGPFGFRDEDARTR